MYGAIEPCDKCNNGNFIFGNSAYLCDGNISEWAKCDNVMKEPKRIPIKIPKSIHDKHKFLSKKFKVQTRAMKDIVPVFSNKTKVKKDGHEDIEQ